MIRPADFDPEKEAEKAEAEGEFGGTDGGTAPPQGGSQLPGNPREYPQTDTTPVPFDYARFPGGSADAYERFNMRYPSEYYYRTMANARGHISMLRAQSRDPQASPQQRGAYGVVVDQLRKYTNSKLGTMGAVDTAWDELLTDAQEGNVAALQLLYAGNPDEDKDSDGSGGKKYGTSSSVTYANEVDVEVLANQVALNMIGRNLSQKEFNAIYSDFRKEEGRNPTVATTSPGGSVTQQGTTAAEREDILKELVTEMPEFAVYQGGEGLLDKMQEINTQTRAENAGL